MDPVKFYAMHRYFVNSCQPHFHLKAPLKFFPIWSAASCPHLNCAINKSHFFLTSHFISWRKYHQSMSSLRSSCFSLFSPLLIYFCTRTMNLESDFKRRAQRKLSSGRRFKSTWECIFKSTPENCLKPLVAVVLVCDNDDGLTTCCCCSCLYAPW